MADQRLVEQYVEFRFPIWVVIDTDYAKQQGPTFAVHFLRTPDGGDDLPVFTTEANAVRYMAAAPLVGHEPMRVDGDTDMKIIAGVFRNRGGTYVRIDDPSGRTTGLFCPTLDGFLSLLR